MQKLTRRPTPHH